MWRESRINSLLLCLWTHPFGSQFTFCGCQVRFGAGTIYYISSITNVSIEIVTHTS